MCERMPTMLSLRTTPRSMVAFFDVDFMARSTFLSPRSALRTSPSASWSRGTTTARENTDLRRDQRILVSKLEGELVDERYSDRVHDLRQRDLLLRSPDLTHEDSQSLGRILVRLHVEERQDRRRRCRLREHHRDRQLGRFGDLGQHRHLVVEDERRKSVLAGEAEEGVAGLVEAVEGGGESGGGGVLRIDEDGADDGKVRLN